MRVRTYWIFSIALAAAGGVALLRRGDSVFENGVDPGLAVLVTFGWIALAYGLYRFFFRNHGDPGKAGRAAILVQVTVFFVGAMIVYVAWSFDLSRSEVASQCAGAFDGWEASPEGADACRAFPDDSYRTLFAGDLNDPPLSELRARYESNRSTEAYGWPYGANTNYDIGVETAKSCATALDQCARSCGGTTDAAACFQQCAVTDAAVCVTTMACLSGTMEKLFTTLDEISSNP